MNELTRSHNRPITTVGEEVGINDWSVERVSTAQSNTAYAMRMEDSRHHEYSGSLVVNVVPVNL